MHLILILLAGIVSGASVQNRDTVAREAYLAGDSATALENWSTLLAEDGVSAARLSAMGNAEWRLGRRGRAMVCWERALSLDTSDPVARAGILHATSLGGVERPRPTWQEQYAATLNPDTWTALTLLSFWVLVLTWAWPRLRGRKLTDTHHKLLLTAFTLLVLSIPGAWGTWTSRERAIVRLTEENLKLTPTALGEYLAPLGEGDVVRTQRRLNGHVRVELSGGQIGWVREEAVEAVWGVTPPRSLDAPAQP